MCANPNCTRPDLPILIQKTNWCRSCYYKSKKKPGRSTWMQTHPERARELLKKSRRKRRIECPEHVLWVRCKHRARKMGLPFDLSVLDIVIPEYCPIFPYIKLNLTHSKARFDSPSVDQIKPGLGYIKGNVRVISHRANMLKSNMTLDEITYLVLDFTSRAGEYK